MADETIRIVLEGQDKVSAVLANTANAMRIIKGVVEGAQTAFRVYNAVVDQTIGVTLEYAKQVKTLSAVSGESAENTSRFVQVLDDFQIGAEDALVATKALTRQGLKPNIATLAQLSDEYLKLTTAEERNAFVIKNLGKGGLEWVNVLKQGRAALIARGDAVNKNLLLDEQAIRKTEKYRLALDELNDTVLGLKVSLSLGLLPTIQNFISMADANITGWVGIAEAIQYSSDNAHIFNGAADKTAFLMNNIADAAAAAVGPTHDNADEVDNLTRGYISMAQALEEVEGGFDGVTASFQDVLKMLDPLQAAFDKLETEGAGAWFGIRDAVRKATLSMLEQKYMIDGDLAPAEYAVLAGLKKAWGMLDEGTQDVGESIDELVQKFLAGEISALQLQDAIDSLHGTSIDIHVNYLTSTAEGAGQSVTNPPAPGAGTGTGTTPSGQPVGGMAGGGKLGRGWTLVGDAPGGRLTPYSELVSPSGYVIPAAQTRAIMARGMKAQSAASGVGDFVPMASVGSKSDPLTQLLAAFTRMEKSLPRAIRDGLQQVVT
jgi:hypothetical protein